MILRTPWRALALLSLILLSVRLYAATRIGFGDAEALYATYALHPQPSYLDHPGLVGAIARMLGGGGAPSPVVTHAVTSVAATLLPWLATLVARLAGAEAARAPIAGLALAAAPEITVGLFGLTPDLVLAPLWLATLGAAVHAVRSTPGTPRALFSFLAAGAFAGLAADGKVTGLLLVPVLILSVVRSPHARSAGPWLGLALAALLFVPVAAFEVTAGFPMLRHRLVDTQAASGLSLRNVGALIGGQIAYLSPIVAACAFVMLRRLAGSAKDDTGRLLRLATFVPLAPLAIVCLWSRVAEPHWIAPALLALPILVARGDVVLPLRLARLAVPTGLVLSAIAHAWVLTDLAPRWLGSAYEARYDLANDLYAARPLARSVRGAAMRATERFGVPPAIVAVHWTVAAQLASSLGSTSVTTRGDASDDFSRWMPPAEWDRRPAILWVTDDRFDVPPPSDWAVVDESSVTLMRGGRVVRRARVLLLARETGA